MSSCPSAKQEPAEIATASPSVAESSPCTISLADQVASCALDHYHKQLTKKAKPKPGEEWTVFAAIVAVHRAENNRMWVVSSATGTKCTAQRRNELILHDSHAEVLARRGFIRVLLEEITKKNSGNKSTETTNDVRETITHSNDLLMGSTISGNDGFDGTKPESKPNEKRYQLNSNIGIHLYISDSPCGDACIYRIPSAFLSGGMSKDDNGNEILYTGAKVIISKTTKVNAKDCGGEHQLLPTGDVKSENGKEKHGGVIETPTSGPVVAREVTQVLGKLRTKSGRSNLPAHMRSHSHSCSDKIVLWGVLGLQGALLTKFLDPPIIPLTSVVVSIDSRLLTNDDNALNGLCKKCDHQQIALERAIPDRARKVWESLDREQEDSFPVWKPPVPTVHIVRRIFESGKAAMIVASKEKHLSGAKRKHDDGKQDTNCSAKDRETGTCDTKNIATKPTKVSPCGVAFNYQPETCIEVLVGSRGIKHGKKPKRPQDFEKLASRLSRAKLMHDFSSLVGKCFRCTSGGKSYREIKDETARSEWRDLKNRILTQSGSPLAGWLRTTNTDDDFPSGERDETE